MQHRFWSALAATALVGLTALCAAAAAPLKVAFVYVGPISDGGRFYQHNLGRLAREKQFGARIETSYVESVPETADAERVIRQLAAKGYHLHHLLRLHGADPEGREIVSEDPLRARHRL